MAEKGLSRVSRLTRGAVSKRTGMNIETIRYYERAGLMPDPPRSPGGHRLYDEKLLKRLIFIRRGRELGFTLEEVRGLLRLVDGGDYSCGEVKALTLDHLGEIQRKVADLRNMAQVLKEMAAQCEGGTVPDCPIIDTLFRERP